MSAKSPLPALYGSRGYQWYRVGLSTIFTLFFLSVLVTGVAAAVPIPVDVLIAAALALEIWMMLIRIRFALKVNVNKGDQMTESTWWYNHKTKQVEEGPQSLGSDRDGPYGSREDAERAPEIAAERSRRWAAEEAADD